MHEYVHHLQLFTVQVVAMTLGVADGLAGDDAFTADLKEEQPWLTDLRGKSVTELEILHGVLNNPDMAGRSFFYFRDPAYAQGRGPDFLSETPADADKQAALKTLIRTTCAAKHIALRENYPDSRRLAAMVLEDLKAAINGRFPEEEVPDALTREAQSHEAFAEIRRRTYIGRPEYFEALDRSAACEGGPLVLLGESGSGKSALLANWLAHWRKNHSTDFIVQHYIGGTADSADHWRLMTRVMAEIKRWSGDSEALPTKHDDILKDFPLWLAKARARAAYEGVRFILVLDAPNQLDGQDHARLLGWLPEYPFTGPLRLIVSTLPGKPGAEDPLEAARKRGWEELRVGPLTVQERRLMIADYLARFGKKLDQHRLDRLASAAPAANPLYVKILLDDLRVTGTHDRLDDRLTEYLAAADIPALLKQVLARYRFLRPTRGDKDGAKLEPLGRSSINRMINQIHKMGRWGVGRQITTDAQSQLLKEVRPLRAGRTIARDQPRRRPITEEELEAAIARLTTVVADMVRLPEDLGAGIIQVLGRVVLRFWVPGLRGVANGRPRADDSGRTVAAMARQYGLRRIGVLTARA